MNIYGVSVCFFICVYVSVYLYISISMNICISISVCVIYGTYTVCRFCGFSIFSLIYIHPNNSIISS